MSEVNSLFRSLRNDDESIKEMEIDNTIGHQKRSTTTNRNRNKDNSNYHYRKRGCVFAVVEAMEFFASFAQLA